MAPVKWKYFVDTIDLEFKAGFLGAEQREDGVIAPVLGWYIQRKPPKRPGWDDDDASPHPNANPNANAKKGSTCCTVM